MTTPRAACLLGLALIAAAVSCRSIERNVAPTLRVIDLRCEHLEEPLGIGTPVPLLSWKVQSRSAQRGVGWNAVQVQVVRIAEVPFDGSPLLWDSGWIEGESAVSVTYGGRALAARDSAAWRVRVRDLDGGPSWWSSHAPFSVGLLAESDWTGDWIGAPDADGDGRTHAPRLERSFELSAEPARAFLHVASIGYHEPYVNGSKVGDAVLAPSVSDLSERVRAVTYDVTDHLRTGANDLALWLGPGWSRYPRYAVPAGPLVRAELDVVLQNGTGLRIATGPDWLVQPTGVEAIGGWSFGDYGGERVDASRNKSTGSNRSGTNRPGRDVPLRHARVFEPAVTIVPDAVEPNRRLDELRPVSIEEVRPGVWRVDMGRAFTGVTEARLRGAPGATIRLSFAEREEQELTYAQRSELIVGPDGEGTFRHRFNYAAARWITIEGASEAPRPEDVRGWLVRSGYPDAGAFRCDDPLLQRIHDTVVWTFECLSLGGYVVDCAHRERWGYGGDAHATMETALTHFDLAAFYGKWLDDWAAIQDEFDNLPFTCPTYRGGGGPAWSGIVVMLPWEIYRRTADRRLLERAWPTIERWLAFLETKTENGILQLYFDERYTRDVYSFLGDWVPPGGVQAGGAPDERRKFFNNAYRVWAVRTAARIAGVLGREGDAQRLRARADVLADAVHRRFFDREQGVYVEPRQTYYALPILAGIGSEAVRADLFERLVADVEERRHVDTGIHGTWFLVKLLLERDRADLLHLVASQQDYPSWGHMLEQGATTIWEQWDGINSRMHSSFLSIGAFFTEGILGIRPLDDTPGFARFVIAPAIGVGGLTEAEGHLKTVRGTIHCSWVVDGDRAALTISVPAGTTAVVRIPTSAPFDVRESGIPAPDAQGVADVQIHQSDRVWETGLGRSEFRCEVVSGNYLFTFAR